MKYSVLLLISISICSLTSRAQTDSIQRSNDYTLQVEASSIVLVSAVFVNFERRILSTDSDKFHMYGRVGYGYMEVFGFFLCDDQSATGGSVAISMLFGHDNHHFEASGGAFIGTFKSKNNPSIFGSCLEPVTRTFPLIDVGYRFQKLDGGLVFRAKLGSQGLGLGVGVSF